MEEKLILEMNFFDDPDEAQKLSSYLNPLSGYGFCNELLPDYDNFENFKNHFF